MRSLFESLLRLYEFDGPASTVAIGNAKARAEGRLAELPNKDASTFPYLP